MLFVDMLLVWKTDFMGFMVICCLIFPYIDSWSEKGPVSFWCVSNEDLSIFLLVAGLCRSWVEEVIWSNFTRSLRSVRGFWLLWRSE